VYFNLEERKEQVRKFIVAYPKTTSKEIKKKLHIKVERAYIRGMWEAFEDAGVPFPRNFKRTTVEEKKKKLFDYVRANPKVGGHIIRKATKINFLSIFNSTQELFEAAGIEYPRKEFRQLITREAGEKRKKILELLRGNPLMSLEEIGEITRTHPHSLFNNTKEMYGAAGIRYVSRSEKRITKKKMGVINYIKNNPFATQREINAGCHTSVQHIFKTGIFEAYKQAGVPFPFERLRVHGSAIKSIRKEAQDFEDKIADSLRAYGAVNQLVRTKTGRADVILERNGRRVVVEIKNYKSHEISLSEIKQLNRYLVDVGTNLGFLICVKKPKKDTFLMDENKIVIVESSELSIIPKVLDKGP